MLETVKLAVALLKGGHREVQVREEGRRRGRGGERERGGEGEGARERERERVVQKEGWKVCMWIDHNWIFMICLQ
jgi:hypothetical protein